MTTREAEAQVRRCGHRRRKCDNAEAESISVPMRKPEVKVWQWGSRDCKCDNAETGSIRVRTGEAEA